MKEYTGRSTLQYNEDGFVMKTYKEVLSVKNTLDIPIPNSLTRTMLRCHCNVINVLESIWRTFFVLLIFWLSFDQTEADMLFCIHNFNLQKDFSHQCYVQGIKIPK